MKDSIKLLTAVGLLAACTVFVKMSFAAEEKKDDFSYDDYAAVLKTYVDDKRMVDYKKLKTGREKLDSFVTAMAKLDARTFGKWSKQNKIAFWLNAYNALTLEAIIDNYPIKSSFFRSRLYPKNSIRQIPGVWSKITFTIVGQDLTLERIEHEILRKKFNEPRIHVAMVCAAMGCPPLLNEPYEGEKLDSQLDDQAQRFLGNNNKFKIDRDAKRVYFSPILKWFASDFVERYGAGEKPAGHTKGQSAVVKFVSNYLEKADTEYLLAGKYKIKYLKYDWSLNEQSQKQASPSNDKPKR